MNRVSTVASVAPAVAAERSGAGQVVDRPGAGRGPAAPSDEGFVRELYERFGTRVLVFTAELTGDWQWAEDIVQMTMLRAWRSRCKLAGLPASQLCSWLFTVAHRIVIDEYRARSARPVVLTDNDDAPKAGSGDHIEQVLSSMAITAALGRLSHRHRQVIVLSFFWQLSIREAADCLGIAAGTVKSRLHYGLRALRQALQERETGTPVDQPSTGHLTPVQPVRGTRAGPTDTTRSTQATRNRVASTRPPTSHQPRFSPPTSSEEN